jgi:hypothetical protein
VIFDGLDDKAVAELCREDFSAARQSRIEIEQRKLEDYRLYRRWRKELDEGGRGERTNGPFGWSRLTVPLVFLIVETILPRIGVNPPTITAVAQNPASVRFQLAKQLRINHQMKMARMEQELLLSLKQFLILGDGPVKTPWDASLGGPRMIAIDWFDWFVSPDAQRWWEAEVLYHRTWHTARSLKALAARDKERTTPLYDHEALERVAYGTQYREGQDDTFAARRDAAGLGTPSWPHSDGPVALVEAHYRDGSMAVIAGDESPIAVRIEREPLFKDPEGRPFRPFSVLQNTPDLFQPYGISDAEMIADHQHESSTVKNQAIDQATGNINAPKAYNRGKINAAEIQAAWSQPNGLLPVDGNPADVIVQFPPGQLSGDVERILEHNRREAQEIAGVNDIVQGIAATQAQTATEIASLREEANYRFRLKLKLVQLGMRTVAQHFDWLDRAISTRPVWAEIDQDFQAPPDARGLRVHPDGGFARIDTSVNAPGLQYELELDAGAMAPPGQTEQANRIRVLLADLMNPAFAPLVNVPELARRLVEAHGEDPDKVLNLGLGQGGLPGMPGPGVPGASPGAVPEGPPVPIGPEGNGTAPPGAEEPVGPPTPVG